MNRIVLVTKSTRFEELILKHLTENAARFSLKSREQSIAPYEEEHRAYHAALTEVRQQLPNDVPVATVSREQVPHFLFRPTDLIVVCGPDGLFANLAKYVNDQLILSVNPDPRVVQGALMLFPPKEVGAVITRVAEGTHRTEALPLVKALFDDGRVLWGVNDIFIGRKDHVSARYSLTHGGASEHHSSSGIIVSTGVGATGWMRSVQAMVAAINGNGLAGKLARLPGVTSAELVFVVREPFPSPVTETRLVTGRIVPEQPLVVTSEMPEGGAIFSDGVVEKALEWNAGSTVTITVGDRYVQRIVP